MQQNINSLSLVKLTLSALLFAAVMLITVILPAEYNIDPTGIGKQLGLTQLAPQNLSLTIKQDSAQNTDQTAPQSSQTENSSPIAANDINTITVPAHKGVEFKFAVTKFNKMSYEWHTDGAELYFDLHGEPKGDTTGYFESYTIATAKEIKGSFTAPFTGSHGWYWKNTSDQAITVSLTTSGQYLVEGLRH